MDAPRNQPAGLHQRRAAAAAARKRRRLVALVALLLAAGAVVAIVIAAAGGGSSPAKSTAAANGASTEGGGGGGAGPQFPAGWRPDRGPVPILEYHAIQPPVPGNPYPDLFVPQTDLERQMAWLH